VKTDYDRSANFAQYKTFSWQHVKTKDALDVDRIKNAVNAALAAKGWTQVDSGGDVSIIAIEMTQQQQTLNTFYDGFGGGWGWRRFGGGGFGEATTKTDTYKVGTVIVDLFDTKTKQLIGEATRVTHSPTTLTRTLRISTRASTKCSSTFLPALRRGRACDTDRQYVYPSPY